MLVSTYFFDNPNLPKGDLKPNFGRWVIGLLFANTWLVKVLILAIINIDRAVSNPVVHTQRDEMILEDGRTETPCSLNETSSKFRVVACADGCMYVCTNLAFKFIDVRSIIFQANLLRLRFIWIRNCSFQSLVSSIYPHWCAVA